MARIGARLNVGSVPKLVGQEARVRFFECMTVLENTSWPLYLVGPSGSGKSIMAMNLAKAYSKEHEVPAYYVQLSPEQTKTSLILGLRLVDGSLKGVKGVIAEAMEEGGVVVVDEATHTTQELLLMFNSILDRTSVTSIGEQIIYATDTFRVIFTANDSAYAGNVRLPQSFAQRLAVFNFDYPSAKDEARIARKIAQSECKMPMTVPDGTFNYLVAFMREVRTERFPLSARNVALAAVRLNLCKRDESRGIAAYFTGGPNVESVRRSVAQRVLLKEAQDATEITGAAVVDFIQFVSEVGVEKFREIVLSSCMYHLDVDGNEIGGEALKAKLAGAVI